MLRTNLATRPFYNERAVHLVLAALAVLLVLATALNVRQILSLSRRLSAERSAAAADEQRARDLRQKATRLRASLNEDELKQLLAAADEANTIIEQRTFSWTELFNHLEATLPADVMLTTVRPAIRKGEVLVTLGVIGKSVDDIDTFMENLERTGAFSNLLSRDEELLKDGTFRATLEGRYARASGAAPRAPADAPPATRGED